MQQTLTILCAIVLVVNGLRLEPFSDEMARYVNKHPDALWTAAASSKFNGVEDMRTHLGALLEPVHEMTARRPTISHPMPNVELPKSFDAREQWPECKSVGEIRDQSSCGSCWAFGATEVMSDRLCIQSGGKINVDLSARDLISCCDECGYGCFGGYSGRAFDFWKKTGIVTGGTKEQATGCLPYPFPSCTHHGESPYEKCPGKLFPTPECVSECAAGYGKSYTEDKFMGASSYNVPSDEQQIMLELMNHGPVEASFTVFADFGLYKSGIYHHLTGDKVGGHAIRLIGWGEENGVKYWLLANSWNEYWGEKGFFRMLRGVDECGIESRVVAGLAKVSTP